MGNPPIASDITIRRAIIAFPLLGLLFGSIFAQGGDVELAEQTWIMATLPVLVFLCMDILSSLRQGKCGLDVVAALSMSVALLFGEELAATVVALMYAGGQYLELFAEGLARREMSALLNRAPRSTLRYDLSGLVEVPSHLVIPGDRLLIRTGDIVPVDGVAGPGGATLDTAVLTGEFLPQARQAGGLCESGSVNVGPPFDLTATKRASDSVYVGIVRLVDAAQRSKAPMARIADRYAVIFLLLTVVLAVVAWVSSGDPVRVVAVLVVATPCPLLLAVPIALVAGMSRAASQGVLIQGGKSLENVAKVTAVVLDKTGTLTDGRPTIVDIIPERGFDSNWILRLAASLNQASPHIVAATLVAEANRRGLALLVPTEVVETVGQGLSGQIGTQTVSVGNLGYLADRIGTDSDVADGSLVGPGMMQVGVTIGEHFAGRIILADVLRKKTPALIAHLRAQGIRFIALATGDSWEVAHAVTVGLDVDAIEANLSPSQKVGIVNAARLHGPVMMIGDGVNDAPALSVADVGVTMGVRGSAGSIEASDIVLLRDGLDSVLTAITVAKRARTIAVQSVTIGIALSVTGMLAAALGLLTPIKGALLHECIDVAVILNALRARYAPAVKILAS